MSRPLHPLLLASLLALSGCPDSPRSASSALPDPTRTASAPRLKVPVLGLYGGADTGIPLETVERMREALAKGESGSEIVVYPGAPHGFHADYRPSYRKEAAEDGWKRMLDWFRRHGAA